ncbi:MAG: hypothetical protein ACOC9J_04820, partial [Persicimonas sp.]
MQYMDGCVTAPPNRPRYKLALALVGAALACAIGAGPAHAQDSDDTEYINEELAPADADKEGFDGTLSTSASVSMTSNRDVVGEVDGFSTLVGLGLDGNLEYINGAHVWNNTLLIKENWSRTPSFEQFIKTTDGVELESLYTYFFRKWFGPFARAAVETSLFDTHVLTAEAQTYEIARIDGSTDTLSGVNELEVSSSFEPLTLQQSLGIFAQPLRDDSLKWTFRVGAGGRQTFAKGVLAVDDDDATEEIEVVELDDVYQAGLEGFTGVTGKFEDTGLTYRAGATALVPFVNNDDEDRSAFELMRWGATAGLSMSVVEWLSVNYDLNVLRDPQLVEQTQVQNNLMLTFKYTLIEAEQPPEPTTAERLEKLREQQAEL